MRVLLIEDHVEVADLVSRALSKDGHHVAIAKSVREANERIADDEHDIAILDLGLPDGDGLEWCRRVRGEGAMFPILVLTAQSAVAKRVEGLDAGADDFLAKPFAVAELRARLRALGRRGSAMMQRRPTTLQVDTARLDFSARRAMVGAREVPLTGKEWSIVELLVSRNGRLVARSEIMESIWGEASPAIEDSLEVIVGRIRKKLGAGIIRTIRGEGYAAATPLDSPA